MKGQETSSLQVEIIFGKVEFLMQSTNISCKGSEHVSELFLKGVQRPAAFATFVFAFVNFVQ